MVVVVVVPVAKNVSLTANTSNAPIFQFAIGIPVAVLAVVMRATGLELTSASSVAGDTVRSLVDCLLRQPTDR